MDAQKIAAFSDGNEGGNPAGVLIADAHPDETTMRQIAAELGFSETAFAIPQGDGWRVRYFSPESEVPFCGHATIALGSALALQFGNGVYTLILNEAEITVEGSREQGALFAALQSPPTHSEAISGELSQDVLVLYFL
jgi:PhzF family phenazine biosynthesis protein